MKEMFTEASVIFRDLPPGYYTVTELNQNWRYTANSMTEIRQGQMINWANSHLHTFSFLNNRSSNLWQDDSRYIKNKMESL